MTSSRSPLDDHDRGLGHDLPRLLHRRRMLQLLGGASLLGAAACTPAGQSVAQAALTGSASDSASASESASASTSASASASASAAATSAATASSAAATPSASAAATKAAATQATACVGNIPEETAGPYPADGTNGVDVLNQSGIVRSNIRSSFGSSTTTAAGVLTTVQLKLVNTSSSCAPVAGAAVYLWHADQGGSYSLYSGDAMNENFLRGVQESDEDGNVVFQSIFPAAYDGRWPHIHFEVYTSLDQATKSGSKLVTSQLAMPTDACNEVYATSGYEQSATNLKKVSLKTDNVFSDGYSLQLPAIGGSVTGGVTIVQTVGVKA